MVSTKTKLCCAESPPIRLRIPVSEQTEKQRAIKKECRKIGRSMASSRYRRRQGEAGKATNRYRMAKKRAEMTDEEKAATNERRKAAAAASYLSKASIGIESLSFGKHRTNELQHLLKKLDTQMLICGTPTAVIPIVLVNRPAFLPILAFISRSLICTKLIVV
ncbi:hypothetical protein F5877DRAFT_71687 [Lentinula edodes]|nr:hypothetical protein F5877DRAFT_71687 [Lentinula edodes]